MKYIFKFIISSIIIFILYTIPVWAVINFVLGIEFEFWKCIALVWVWYLFTFAESYLNLAIKKKYFSGEVNPWSIIKTNVRKRNGTTW